MERQNHYHVKPIRKDIDMTAFAFDADTLTFLLKLLTSEDRATLISIYESTRTNIMNYQKTKVKDYQRLRRQYEVSWGKLEAQGLIQPMNVGSVKVFMVTPNGEKAIELIRTLDLQQEQAQEE